MEDVMSNEMWKYGKEMEEWICGGQYVVKYEGERDGRKKKDIVGLRAPSGIGIIRIRT